MKLWEAIWQEAGRPVITRVNVYPLQAAWEAMDLPDPERWHRPAAHFQAVPRRGQCSTLVRLEDETGAAGWGEAFALPNPQLTATALESEIKPLLLGQPVARWPQWRREWIAYATRLGHGEGPLLEAASGMDLACWDLVARHAGKPLHQLLGDPRRDRIPIYRSPVPFESSPEAAARTALDLLTDGVRALKVKVGRDPHLDLEHLGAIRDACGPEVRLIADANGGWSLSQAVAFCNGLETNRWALEWLEEPLPPCAWKDWRMLRESTRTPLGTGENLFHPAAFEHWIESGLIDYLTPNISRAGGLSGMLELAARVEPAGLRIALHGVGGAIMRQASLHFAAVHAGPVWFEANRLPNPLRDRLLPSPAVASGGFAVPGGEGLGPEPDWEEIRHWMAPSPSCPPVWAGARHYRGVETRVIDWHYRLERAPGTQLRPLLLFLHGAGEKGNDPSRLGRLPVWAGLAHARELGFDVLAPQAPQGPGWPIGDLVRFLDDFVEREPIDPDRIVVSGISMGGRGVWELAYAHADRLAAIAPVCGPAIATLAPRIAELPVWAFHGVRDSVAPVEGTDRMMEALRNDPAERRYSRLEESGHQCGVEVFADRALWQWLAEQRRS